MGAYAEEVDIRVTKPKLSTKKSLPTKTMPKRLAAILRDSGNALLANLLAALPEVIWVRSAGTGAVVSCNHAFEAVWRRSVSELENDPTCWISAIHEDDRAQLKAALRQVVENDRFDHEYRVVGPDGDWRCLHDRAWVIREDRGSDLKLVGSVQDITREKRVETALQSAFDALNSSVNGVILTNRNGRITYANPSFLSLFGYASESEAIGLQAEALFSSKEIEEITDVVDKVAQAGAIAREFRVTTNSGSERIVEVMSSDIHDLYAQRVGSMASFVDITERRTLQRAVEQDRSRLRLLTERLAETEETERRRLATQLHDTAVQSLSLASIKMGALGNSLEASGQQALIRQLEAVRALVTQGIAECRLIMTDLTPPLLYEVGLVAALKEWGEGLRELYHTAIHIEENPGGDVPESLRGVLFQAARELVLNACKHANASSVRIVCHHKADSYCMEVADDGRGFNPAQLDGSKPANSGGFGLFSIRERVRGLGGRLQIDSQPGGGAVIRVWLPRGGSQTRP